MEGGPREKRGRRGGGWGVDPAFSVSGCHLFTHYTVCMAPASFSEESPLHNVSAHRITGIEINHPFSLLGLVVSMYAGSLG